jgi:hypothetical protein
VRALHAGRGTSLFDLSYPRDGGVDSEKSALGSCETVRSAAEARSAATATVFGEMV